MDNENFTLMQMLPGLYYLRNEIDKKIATIEASLGFGKKVGRPRLSEKELAKRRRDYSEKYRAKNKEKANKASQISRKKRSNKSSNSVAAYWAKMTAEERKAEMQRRIRKGLGRKKVAA